MYCSNCGVSVDNGAKTCDLCGAPIQGEAPNVAPRPQYQTPNHTKREVTSQYVHAHRKEHPIFGTIGALIGAIIGGASIIIFSRMGYIAAISGLILAFCTVKGYSLLGRVITNKGLFIIIILIAATPYLANRLDWAFYIYDSFKADYDITLLDAFKSVKIFVEDGIIDKKNYIQEILMIYLFSILGGFSFLKNTFCQ